MTCQLLCVEPSQIKDFWPFAAPFIEKACKRSILDFGGARDTLFKGKAQLWIASDGDGIQAAATTELHKINGRLLCFIAALGGQEHERWIHLITGIEAFARAEKCASVIIMGRPAWQRLLKEYRANGVILEHSL